MIQPGFITCTVSKQVVELGSAVCEIWISALPGGRREEAPLSAGPDLIAAFLDSFFCFKDSSFYINSSFCLFKSTKASLTDLVSAAMASTGATPPSLTS